MIYVTRVCGEAGQWLEPSGLQECYDAHVNERFGEISVLLNQVSFNRRIIGPEYACQLYAPAHDNDFRQASYSDIMQNLKSIQIIQ